MPDQPSVAGTLPTKLRASGAELRFQGLGGPQPGPCSGGRLVLAVPTMEGSFQELGVPSLHGIRMIVFWVYMKGPPNFWETPRRKLLVGSLRTGQPIAGPITGVVEACSGGEFIFLVGSLRF